MLAGCGRKRGAQTHMRGHRRSETRLNTGSKSTTGLTGVCVLAEPLRVALLLSGCGVRGRSPSHFPTHWRNPVTRHKHVYIQHMNMVKIPGELVDRNDKVWIKSGDNCSGSDAARAAVEEGSCGVWLVAARMLQSRQV